MSGCEIGFNAKYLLEIAGQVDRENAVFMFNSAGDPDFDARRQRPIRHLRCHANARLTHGCRLSILSQLTLSHFRSHQRVSMDLDARPVTLFGANGAGKTNILEAISMLSPGRGLRRAALDDISRKPENLGWKVSGILHALGMTHEIETRAEAGSARSVSIDEKTSPQIALGRIARIVWLIPAMDRLWIEGAEGRRRFLDRITLSFEPKHAGSLSGPMKRSCANAIVCSKTWCGTRCGMVLSRRKWRRPVRKLSRTEPTHCCGCA